MPINSDFDKVIPGIALVPDVDLEVFFLKEEGRELKSILDNFKSQTELIQLSCTDSAYLRRIRINNCQTLVKNKVNACVGFDFIKKLILNAMLKQYFFQYIFVNSEDQNTLINKPYTAELYDSYAQAQPISRCIALWKQALLSDTEADAVRVRDQISDRESSFINDMKQKIGFLCATSSHSETQKDILFYALAGHLYYSNINKAKKKQILSKEFNTHLGRYQKYRTSYNFPDLKTCFSYLLHRVAQQTSVKKTKEQIDRIANVHLLFGILGLREPAGWMLENIDIYNYVNFADDVNTLKTVLFAFAKPLRSFFMEYVQITKFEKNPLNFLFRSTIPILIMTCFVAFAFSLMVPFAMHAVIEIIMLIPTLYISMVAASFYVDLKNKAFEALIIYWRGSRYEQDAFKKNDRILLGFSNDANIAESVCNYYVECFTDCDAIVSSLSKKFERGLLTDEQIVYYQAMLKREALLKLEWYDIHDNHYLGVDNIKTLVLKRLHQDAHEAYQDIYREGNKYIEGLIEALEQHLVRSQNTESARDQKIRQAFHPNMRWSMFKPEESLTHLAEKCVRQQKRIESVEKLRPSIEIEPNILNVC